MAFPKKQMVVTDVAPLRGHLKALGLDVPMLHEVVRRGAAARLACTAFHPPSAGGYFQFAELVAALREALCTPTHGWEPDDTANFCTVHSPDGMVAIAVAAGDTATGDPARDPSTEYPKGPLTTAAVETNQMLLFPPSGTGAKPLEAPTTWWLLVAVTSSAVFCELSLPQAVSEAGWITQWKMRLILPPLPLDQVRGVSPSDDEAGDVIDINITKRD